MNMSLDNVIRLVGIMAGAAATYFTATGNAPAAQALTGLSAGLLAWASQKPSEIRSRRASLAPSVPPKP